jgi:xylan 1,4-beta-xylosidase
MTAALLLAPPVECATDSAPSAPTVAAGGPVAVRVDWAATTRATTRHSFGLNGFTAFNPENVAHPKYQANMAYMNPGLVRYHSAEMMGDSSRANGWLDHGAKRWDAAKIKRALDAWRPKTGQALITIPWWPEWMDKNKDSLLDADEYDNFAAFCADLVRIVNVDLEKNVTYWEATNERDGPYWADRIKKNEPDRLDELVKIYNTCAAAMKRVDPAIKVGGPAAARSDLIPYLRRFVRGAKQNLDFFSYHIYASGSAQEPDPSVYDKTKRIGSYTRAIVAMLKEESPDRPIPAHLNEYNISWDWRIRDKRMTSHKGAVFDALALVAAVSSGAEATNAWNERDGIYGKMGPDYRLRPGAHVFHLFNRYLVGDVVPSRSSDDSRIVVWAVKNAAKKQKTLVVINRTGAVQPVTCDFGSGEPETGNLARHEISAQGYKISTLSGKALGADGLTVPEHSVTVLTISADASASSGTAESDALKSAR